MKASSLIFVVMLIVGCGGGGSGGSSATSPPSPPPPPPPPPPPANLSPGGVWIGSDSNGGELVGIVTETGRFHFLIDDGLIDDEPMQGTGIMSVSNVNNLNGNFELVPQVGSVFPDGTTPANCALVGTVTERQSMVVIVDCTTTAGTQEQITATLDYDAIYDRNSSLATIAGNFQDVGEVGEPIVNIAGDGTIFFQDPSTGCVVNGQVSIIDADFNAYDFEVLYSNCTGSMANFNDSVFSGVALLDNTENQEELIAVTTGVVEGVLSSDISFYDRL
jgi:hypothetical protein